MNRYFIHWHDQQVFQAAQEHYNFQDADDCFRNSKLKDGTKITLFEASLPVLRDIERWANRENKEVDFYILREEEKKPEQFELVSEKTQTKARKGRRIAQIRRLATPRS